MPGHEHKSLKCPWCGAFAQFDLVHTLFEDPDPAVYVRRIVARRTYGGSPTIVERGMWECLACKLPILGAIWNSDDELHVMRLPSATPKSYEDVPDDISRDAQEAHACAGVEAWRGAVMLTRRAIQATCNAMGAPRKSLLEQINWLGDEQKITPQMKGMAHRIRLGGNEGAHPDADGLADIDEPDASAVLVLLDRFLEDSLFPPLSIAPSPRRKLSHAFRHGPKVHIGP